MPGEIHAVLGENGAGKSTLMKIIYGVARADEGEVFWNGDPVSIPNSAEARRLGIGMVFQHFSLFETLRRLSEDGCSVLYISHKLEEIRTLCHRATVMRNGRVAGNADPARESAAGLARLMIGHELPVCGHSPPREGARRGSSSTVSRAAPRRDLRLSFVPEDWLGRGVVASMPLSDNCLLTAHRNAMVRFGMVLPARVNAFAEDCVRDFDVRCAGIDAEARSLSGGNLQKFILSWS